MTHEIPLRDETIQLDQFLKIAGLVDSGGQAKVAIQDGAILVNGVVETRRRKKINIGDQITIEDHDDIWIPVASETPSA